MQAILNIKTDRDLKNEAQALASEFGVPLTTIINSYLRQFIRERKLVLEMEPSVKNDLMESWHNISIEENKNNSKGFTNASNLIKYLNI